jgi:hypothetical protein
VYLFFQRLILDDEFPVLPTDDIECIYRIGDEDLEEGIIHLAEVCNCLDPRDRSAPECEPIITVGDFVNYLQKLYIYNPKNKEVEF